MWGTIVRGAGRASRWSLGHQSRGMTQGDGTAAATPVPLAVLKYFFVENMAEKRVPHRSAHLQLARDAARRGSLLLGGAAANPVDAGFLIFRSPQEAREFAEQDPYVRGELVRKYEIREWSVVVGSLYDQLSSD
ncbi:uncharacterized protein MONBRDRAFT_7275 [Monosiga brevicollis MX1]|uniref:YCII-related domain-containing protein n=1 Tax=Monosiga brevicollis TaxID=81824 RepID=A9UWG7_MONBE|nr:uncharacterized protein MONBRDRAFT_7275 [Monosiga brevicollis MX1]EDQ90043.1 predicted protein [Monosiga brevicollis MX1]|eukprot:XP_001744810.1 hypothetical protein [Monosiga brevicollis MX1]